MKTLHLFAGLGGGLLADLILGHEPIGAVEIDPYCCAVLRDRAADGWWPGLRVHECDVRMFDASDYAGRVDVIHAGFPCQDVSRAGSGAGIGEGTRSGLYVEALRVARLVGPRFVFLENVPAIAVHLGTILADLAGMGYDARWVSVRASDCGAPHIRDRLWLLGFRRGPAWVECDGCGEFWCEIHQQHAHECDCDELIELPFDPYEDGAQYMADPSRTRLSLPEQKEIHGTRRRQKGRAITECGWWAAEPALGRVAHGVPHRVQRLKGLGNAQVPLQAALAWKILSAML